MLPQTIPSIGDGYDSTSFRPGLLASHRQTALRTTQCPPFLWKKDDFREDRFASTGGALANFRQGSSSQCRSCYICYHQILFVNRRDGNAVNDISASYTNDGPPMVTTPTPARSHMSNWSFPLPSKLSKIFPSTHHWSVDPLHAPMLPGAQCKIPKLWLLQICSCCTLSPLCTVKGILLQHFLPFNNLPPEANYTQKGFPKGGLGVVGEWFPNNPIFFSSAPLNEECPICGQKAELSRLLQLLHTFSDFNTIGILTVRPIEKRHDKTDYQYGLKTKSRMPKLWLQQLVCRAAAWSAAAAAVADSPLHSVRFSTAA